MNFIKPLVLIWALASSSMVFAGGIPLLEDLQADAAKARAENLVIVLVASLPNCFYCEYVKESHLGPMLDNGELEGVALVREIELAGSRIKGFDGELVDPADFAGKHRGNFSPSVMFISPDGSDLHDPIVGVESRDFYSHYLEKAIEKARKRLSDQS